MATPDETRSWSVERDDSGSWRAVPFGGFNHPTKIGCYPARAMAEDAARVGNTPRLRVVQSIGVATKQGKEPALETVLTALSNMGHDTSCGACMSKAFTGSDGGHEHSCSEITTLRASRAPVEPARFEGDWSDMAGADLKTPIRAEPGVATMADRGEPMPVGAQAAYDQLAAFIRGAR